MTAWHSLMLGRWCSQYNRCSRRGRPICPSQDPQQEERERQRGGAKAVAAVCKPFCDRDSLPVPSAFCPAVFSAHGSWLSFVPATATLESWCWFGVQELGVVQTAVHSRASPRCGEHHRRALFKQQRAPARRRSYRSGAQLSSVPGADACGNASAPSPPHAHGPLPDPALPLLLRWTLITGGCREER